MTDIVNRLRSAATMPFKEAHRTLFRQSADEIERLWKALEEIADPDLALLASTKADIARAALSQQERKTDANT